ncbi:hypothetical protein VTO73DRAFT_6416 [Trametes versicolor]
MRRCRRRCGVALAPPQTAEAGAGRGGDSVYISRTCHSHAIARAPIPLSARATPNPPLPPPLPHCPAPDRLLIAAGEAPRAPLGSSERAAAVVRHEICASWFAFYGPFLPRPCAQYVGVGD